MADDSSFQRISRLTPLAAIREIIQSRVAAVKPQTAPIAAALGQILAEDISAPQWPPQPIALRDGFAVAAAAFGDAGPYMPVPLPPAAPRIETGEPLADGADAVLPLDAVTLRGDRAEAVAPVAPGEGVLLAGADAMPNCPLRRIGEPLRAIDVATLHSAGIKEVTVRAPRIAIVSGSGLSSPVIDGALMMLLRAVPQAGAMIGRTPMSLDAALADQQVDAIIAVGGTGSGSRDAAVQTLAELGHVEAHGIAVSPGETGAFGFVAERPVLLLPGRLDAALAAWLLIGRHVVANLAGGKVEDTPIIMPLKRKVASALGMTELIPVAYRDGMAEPLAAGYLSLTALARSDGWIAVGAESEGFPAGTDVAVTAWP